MDSKVLPKSSVQRFGKSETGSDIIVSFKKIHWYINRPIEGHLSFLSIPGINRPTVYADYPWGQVGIYPWTFDSIDNEYKSVISPDYDPGPRARVIISRGYEIRFTAQTWWYQGKVGMATDLCKLGNQQIHKIIEVVTKTWTGQRESVKGPYFDEKKMHGFW